MMFGGNARAGILHAHLNAVWPRKAKSSALLHRSHGCHSALPEMRGRSQLHRAAAWRMFQGIVEQIRRDLLNLLIIETESRYGRIDVRFPVHDVPHKGHPHSLRTRNQSTAQVILE